MLSATLKEDLENLPIDAAPDHVLTIVEALYHDVTLRGRALLETWNQCIRRPNFAPSATNLAQYMALRSYDLRALQSCLAPYAVSSLGRCESRVRENLGALVATLSRISSRTEVPLYSYPKAGEFYAGSDRLAANASELLGPEPERGRVRIMVTAPAELAHDTKQMKKLVRGGMNVLRINCAHGDPEEWLATVHNLKKAKKSTGLSCRILMDLGGPKARTSTIIMPASRARLYEGDKIFLARDNDCSAPEGVILAVCALPEALRSLVKGREVWIDDGKIGTVVEQQTIEGVLLSVTHAPEEGIKLKPGKGLNFPGTDLDIPALTSKDLQDLDWVVQHADLIGYSFVQSATDVDILTEEIEKRNPKRSLGMIAKIETQKAVENLPSIIVHAAGAMPFGVMIARGDLAVEIGYRRIVEIQEEILWLCEAAHIPVVWATQVLESMVKHGLPTRAEMTDAAMSERAECVMLNKGPYILDAVKALSDVLTRMSGHQWKKMAQLRELKTWSWLFDSRSEHR